MQPTTNSLVRFTTDGKTVEGQVKNPYLQIADAAGKLWYRKADSVTVLGADGQPVGNGNVDVAAPETVAPPHVDINRKFEFVGRLVDMVARGQTPSCLITGEGGLGKTFAVRQALARAGLTEADYVFVSGYSTPKGLYVTLFENSDKLIIFDDCDKVLTDDTAKNILKAALDSYEQRIVTWATSKPDENLPSSFEFTGRVIFISNLSQSKVDQAIISRSMTIDLTMTTTEKLQRMQALLPEVAADVAIERKQACLDLIARLAPGIRDLNMRTLLKAIRISGDGHDWEELASYMLLS